MKTIDKDNMFQSIWDFPENIIDALKISEEIKIKNDYENVNKVIVAGMGGSAIGGDVVNSLIEEDINIPLLLIEDIISLHG